ncbi:MAG TPA: hypothetical protein VLJ39_08175 [Tepidisphaeraceae bacterium]|nr:hypothetical protein [Tepidisphaeraceae bacterium]
MIIAIVCLVIGILGFVKRRINITKNRELRGTGMYVVAALLCLPLPLSFLVGLVMGTTAVASGRPVNTDAVMIAGTICTWGPILLAIILGFAMAKPKEVPPQSAFPVMPPQKPVQMK